MSDTVLTGFIHAPCGLWSQVTVPDLSKAYETESVIGLGKGHRAPVQKEFNYKNSAWAVFWRRVIVPLTPATSPVSTIL